MEELTLDEEFELLHAYGKCLGGRIVSSIILEQHFILDEYRFIVLFKKIRDDEYGDVFEIDEIVSFWDIF